LGRQARWRRELRSGCGRWGVQSRTGGRGASRWSGIHEDGTFRDHGSSSRNYHVSVTDFVVASKPRVFLPRTATTTHQQQPAGHCQRSKRRTDHEMGSFVQKRPERAWRLIQE
jgi:hypothetical protein